MNMLHLYRDYYPVLGGIENHIRQLAEAQVAHGHTVTVLVTSTTQKTETDTVNGVRVIKKADRIPMGLEVVIPPGLFFSD
jgi:hypothetical protein